VLNKIVNSLAAAVADIPDGASILVGGFGGAGVPQGLIDALQAQGTKRLTLIHNNAGRDEETIAKLIKHDRVAKLICTFPESKTAYIFREKFFAGSIELELVPQGTLAERIRAGGSGIEGFFTPTGVGTEVAQGKEVMEFNGVTCILERALRADYAFVRGEAGDRWGNLIYDKAGRNFNPVMAMAGRVTIAEVDEIVELGTFKPEHVVTPGIFVQRVVKTET
jgi:3-oxoadipate CoA-transferase alpha subunit